MINRIKKLYIKYKELILYGIFGVCTTLINIVAFYLLDTIMGCQLIVSNVVAWGFAVIFAFVTNKLYVFESGSWKCSQAVKEIIQFFTVRLLTLFIDTFLMWLLIEIVSANSLFAKIVVNVIVIVLNYVASKLWIFSSKGK